MSGILEETKELEQQCRASADTDSCAGKDAASGDGFKPVLEYSEESASVNFAEVVETRFEPTAPKIIVKKQPKKRYRGVIVVAVLIIFAGLGAAAYSFDIFGEVIGFKGLRIENVTELPVDANPPAFVPLDPAEFAEVIEDALVVVPDETGLEFPAKGGNAAEAAAASKNYYTQTPNISKFYTHAAQDESYIYFLKYKSTADKLTDLMRMKISNGKTEPVPNANETSESIYSFTLFKKNIITCEFKRNTQTYAFYRVPKAFEDAQLLFEQDSPAFMNVHDNKIFMLFALSQKLGVFDPETDTQPAFIDMSIDDENARYLPEFSVMNGYIYYGVLYGEGERMEYLRRSLYTGEVVTMLDSNELGGAQIWNPCWDGEGVAYYGEFEPETGIYSLIALKNGDSPETLCSFGFGGMISPPVTLNDGFLVAAASPDTLCKYGKGDFLLELETAVPSLPYAVTKDFLIAPDGIYRIHDFSFIPLDK